MVRKICPLILLFLLLTLSGTLFSAEVSEKKAIAVFKLSYYDWEISGAALGSIDEEIKSVFINLGRFDIIGMTYRLAQDDVTEFINKIKEYNQENVEIPEKFKMGHEVFTEADMNQLIGSFIVVVPAVSYFNVESGESGHKAEIKTSFSFIKVDEAKTFAPFFVETDGSSDESPAKAVQDAINDIPRQLEFEITKIPEFTLETGILETSGNEIILKLGRNMGIRLGYEFSILSISTVAGRQMDVETGLVLVKDVMEEVSVATVLFGSPAIGDQLKEVPRLGFEITPYFDFLLNPFDSFRPAFTAGFRVSRTKYLYKFRPLVGVEVPLPIGGTGTLLPFLWLAGLPFNVYLGGEVAFYLGRLQITPQAAFGLGMIVPRESWTGDENYVLSHIGFMLNGNFSLLIHKTIKITLNVGYKQYIGIWDQILLNIIGLSSSYGGILVGGGATIKL